MSVLVYDNDAVKVSSISHLPDPDNAGYYERGAYRVSLSDILAGGEL